MKKINPLGITGYEFNELPQEAKDKAIADQIEFWMEAREYDEETPGNYEKAIDKAEQMQTPWFTGSYIYEYCKDELVEEIEINEYLFDEAGEILPITHHSRENEIVKTTFRITKNKEIEVKIA